MEYIVDMDGVKQMPECKIEKIDVSPWLLVGDVVAVTGCAWTWLRPWAAGDLLALMLGVRNIVAYQAWKKGWRDIYDEYKEKMYGSPEEEIGDLCRVLGYRYIIWVTDGRPQYDILLLPDTEEEYRRLVSKLRHPRLLAIREIGKTLLDIVRWKLKRKRYWEEE